MKIEIKITLNDETREHIVDSPMLDDVKLKTLIWEDWEGEIKEESPLEMVLKYMKIMRDQFLKP